MTADYTPPTFAEFEAIVGRDETSLGNARLYSAMCLAMSCRTFDRTVAFERLRELAQNNWEHAKRRAAWAQDREAAEAAERERAILSAPFGYDVTFGPEPRPGPTS